MKHKILYLFLSSAVLLTACLKTVQPPPPPPVPSGTFTGVYKRFHRSTGTGPYDTVQTNLTVKFSIPDYTYTVTGDTSTIHAGSYGAFGITSPYIGFADKTYSAKSTSTKAHLNGYYNYSYDGTNLLIYATSSDTLLIGYTLKKSSN